MTVMVDCMKIDCNSLNSRKNSGEIRNAALLKAASACGGVKALALLIKVSPSTIYRWMKQVRMNIPYELALLIEKHSKVSIEKLLPHEKKLNKYIKERSSGNFMFRKVAKNRIIIADLPYISCPPDRPIIIGTDLVLISGLIQLQAQKNGNIKVLILDLETFFLSIPFFYNPNKFLIVELIAIGLRLENLIKNRTGQCNDFKLPTKNNIDYYSTMKLDPNFVSTAIKRVATFLGFLDKASYLQAKKAYLQFSQNNLIIDR